MNLRRKKKSKNLTLAEIRKKQRLEKQVASTSNTIKYTSNFEDGLMHILEDKETGINEWSKVYKMGNLDYEVASDEDQLNIVASYGEALNSVDKLSRYQLLVLNKKIKSSILKDILFNFEEDGQNQLRDEMNGIISNRYAKDQRSFEIEKYSIFSTQADSRKQAHRKLDTLFENYQKRFNESDVGLTFTPLTGEERMHLMAGMLRPGEINTISYRDLALMNRSSKDFIAPTRLKFEEECFRLNNYFGKVLYVRKYPEEMEDQLIKELCDTGRELAISLHAKPYDMHLAKKDLQNKKIMNKADRAKQQKDNFKQGLSDDMVSGLSTEVEEATEALMREFRNGQKLFSGIFAVMVIEKSREALQEAVNDIKDAGGTWMIEFEECYKMQEEALNTMLPIGKPYLDVESNYMRDMLTTNVVTQIPFTNIELQDPTGQYYGQNQMSKNIITINRKKFNTPSGLILGSPGSGKGMTVKWEIISNLLRNKEDRFIIVDPESEYLPIGERFGATILDISSGTNHHFNILDLADVSLLDKEDRKIDLVKEKASLLSSLFASVLQEYNDLEAAMVDRVTTLTYQRFKNVQRQPTLVDWYGILKEQAQATNITETEQLTAQDLVLKTEPYTVGSQNIFAHETNIDMDAKFIVFNIKHLNDKMKPFAMKVILDQIWRQVVANQNKVRTHLYFDELQLNFDTEENATWFTNLWSRVRKYGAWPTGITQNIITLLEVTAGKKMINNSDFIILLRQKLLDVEQLSRVVKLPRSLLKYVGEKVSPGTGLICAEGVVVPFENPIPADTELFELMNTDAV